MTERTARCEKKRGRKAQLGQGQEGPVVWREDLSVNMAPWTAEAKTPPSKQRGQSEVQRSNIPHKHLGIKVFIRG